MFVLQITKHHSKPGVTPLEILPVYPDFEVDVYIYMPVKYLYHLEY